MTKEEIESIKKEILTLDMKITLATNSGHRAVDGDIYHEDRERIKILRKMIL